MAPMRAKATTTNANHPAEPAASSHRSEHRRHDRSEHGAREQAGERPDEAGRG